MFRNPKEFRVPHRIHFDLRYSGSVSQSHGEEDLPITDQGLYLSRGYNCKWRTLGVSNPSFKNYHGDGFWATIETNLINSISIYSRGLDSAVIVLHKGTTLSL